MALYQVKIKGSKDACNYYAYRATSIEEAITKAVGQHRNPEKIEHVKFLFSDDDLEGAIKQMQLGLEGLFLELHHLGYVGHISFRRSNAR